VGLSEGEGQAADRAWWARLAGQPPGQVRIEVLNAGWDNWVLSDVDPSGSKVTPTPHGIGPLLVRAFPSLEVLRTIDPPGEDTTWDYTACFAGDMLVDRLRGFNEQRLAAIDQAGAVHDLKEQEDEWLIPAANGTWLAATRTTIRRCGILRS
jgi:hypothetical protein